MTTENRLDEIKARAAAIRRGPWRWMGNTASDRLYLATTHSGQETILAPDTRAVEYVYHHGHCESYELAEARERVRDWCGFHDEDPDPDESPTCRCEDIRSFLIGALDEGEGHRELDRDSYVFLTRGVQVFPDLRLGEGGRLVSYRDHVRYEVLGRVLGNHWGDYRTKAEWAAEKGAITGPRAREGSEKTVEDALYREDWVGLDHPEATFIEHSAEDIPWLIAEVERLTAENEALRASVMEGSH